MIIPVATTLGRGVSKAAGMQSLVNMYLEPIERDGRTEFSAIQMPGRTLFSTIGGGKPRGQINAADKHYVVIGNSFYYVNETGVETFIGFIDGEKRVDMSFNGVQIDIVAENKTYEYDTLTAAFAEISTANFEQASTTASVASYSLFGVVNTGRFRWRLVNTPTFAANDFATAEAEADVIVAMRKIGNEIAILGKTSIEWWQPTGDAGAFAFGKTQVSAASIGCLSRDSALVVDNILFWVGRDSKAGGVGVYRAEGYQPKKVSTAEVDKYLEEVSDPSLFHCRTFQRRGHQFLVVTCTDQITVNYDLSTGIWTFGKTGHFPQGAEPLGGQDAVTFALNGNNQIIGCADGNLYKLDPDVFTENGLHIINEITFPQIHGQGKQGFMSRFELDIEAGVGLITGQGSEPIVMESHSDDGGMTWSSVRQASLGKTGQYRWRAIWLACGSFRQRIIKVRCSDPVKFAVMGGFADVQWGAH